MKPIILLLSTVFFMSLNSLNSQAAPPPMTIDIWEEVENFLDKFSKSKFMERLKEDKAYYEQSVRWIKANEHRIDTKTLQKLKAEYWTAQDNYNKVTNLMLQDVHAMNSLFTFLNTSPFEQYKARLKTASDSGREFLFHAYVTYLEVEKIRTPPKGNPEKYGIQAWILAFAPEIISKAHDAYLDHLKSKMRAKLYNVRLLDWKDI